MIYNIDGYFFECAGGVRIYVYYLHACLPLSVMSRRQAIHLYAYLEEMMIFADLIK